MPMMVPKSGMAQALQSIASERWIPLAAVMVGTVGKNLCDFLQTDLQQRLGLDVVMTVGLHLCALELTDQQLDTLACLALAGLLPEFFPFEHWILAVKKSFLSQEVVVCSTRGQWDEVQEILQ